MPTSDAPSKQSKVVEAAGDGEISEIQEKTMRIIPTPGASVSETEVKSRLLDNRLADIKNMMNKMYALQKRMIVGDKTTNPLPVWDVLNVNNINLLSLPGKTASRFLLSAARIVLTDEQFNNGYLPDFRGNKAGRVPISQESFDKLKVAVRFRFGYKEEDMCSIWTSIRTSLVQKITEIRKSKKRYSEKTQSRFSAPPSQSSSSTEDHFTALNPQLTE